MICDTNALGTQTFTTYFNCVLTLFNELWFQGFIIWQTFHQKVFCTVCCFYFPTRTKHAQLCGLITWLNVTP